MDIGCILLTCMLLVQMVMILVMLNPVYDVRKITRYLNYSIKLHKRCYCATILSYFFTVIYLGMYLPLQNVHHLIFEGCMNDMEKLVLLRKIEKNYIIAGFSLFLVVVLYGVRALISYTASLIELTEKSSEPLVIGQESKDSKKALCSSVNILPNLLRVKRSISYETILFTNELRDQLKNVLRNVEFPHKRPSTLTSILEIQNQTAL